MDRDHGVHLIPVYRPEGTDVETDIDIIAIHGLDTNAPHTWTFKDRDLQTSVNWLAHADMLPREVGAARIFMCNWPADLFQSGVSTTLKESAERFLRCMQPHLASDGEGGMARRMFFIASCLGGIILIKALRIEKSTQEKTDSPSLIKATRGIVFLATPFKGTSYNYIPDAALKVVASVMDQNVTELVDYAKDTKTGEELVQEFTSRARKEKYHVFNFWEARETSLFAKFHLSWMFSKRVRWLWAPLLVSSRVFNRGKLFSWALLACQSWWIGFYFYRAKTLVDQSSANAGGAFSSQRLDRNHILMNKFRNQECGDYKQVATVVRNLLTKIRGEKTLLDKADEAIREYYLTNKKIRLKIVRLSRAELPMDQCYINLALLDNQKDQISENTTQVELSKIFNHREVGEKKILPRRILIRGCAGVGKTTLCKKIVYEYTEGNLGEWETLFNRILWLPLRVLKGFKSRPLIAHDLRGLFRRVYFPNNHVLAEAVFREVNAKNTKTLFLLDGLDEVSGMLANANKDEVAILLLNLLNHPNVIITSRPRANFDTSFEAIDLELETVGFSQEQMDEYIAKTFRDPDSEGAVSDTAAAVQEVVKGNWRLNRVARIPIQLDALCCSWHTFSPQVIAKSTTAIYKAIELWLWKKDILRLGKTHGRKKLEENDLASAGFKTERYVGRELRFLEALAFTGMNNDTIVFTSDQMSQVDDVFTRGLLLQTVLPLLSFIRISDTSFDDSNYNFVHGTFQEYFAARYFVRQWKHPKGQLQILTLDADRLGPESISAVSFCRKHKYTARYHNLWRFVAGLLDCPSEESQVARFINILEDEPKDFLGPTHQRLLMYCLGEISFGLPSQAARTAGEEKFQKTRMRLERRFPKWQLFEWRSALRLSLGNGPHFSALSEFALRTAFLEGPIEARVEFWDSARQTNQLHTMRAAAEMLRDEHERLRGRAAAWLTVFMGQPDAFTQKELLPNILTWIVSKDESEDVKKTAVKILQDLKTLPVDFLQELVSALPNVSDDIRSTIIDTLCNKGLLKSSDRIQLLLGAWIIDRDSTIREIATRLLRGGGVEGR